MKIETIEIAGFAAALSALRLSYGKSPRSELDIRMDEQDNFPEEDSAFVSECKILIDNNDIKLMNALIEKGPEHAKVMRGIVVWARITAPIYWWTEAETYVVGHQRLMSESTMHIDCRGLSGDDLVAAKAAIPMGKELTKIDAFSYQALRNIANQRWNHRLPEWHAFVDWIKSLPFAAELILPGLKLN